MVREFKPQMWIYADSSVPGACFRSCVSLSLCPSPALSLSLSKINIKKKFLNSSDRVQVSINLCNRSYWGAWVAQSVKRLTSAQVMTSQFMGSSPVSDSALTAQSLEPASGSGSPSLSAPPPLTLCLSLSKINKH